MPTEEDLIRENRELRARLELAEKWMQREVQIAMQSIQKKGIQSSTRKHFSNLFEQEGIDIIVKRITDMFGEGLKNAPEHTLERLIDAEIYWQTLQKYPTMDGLPVILSYQKILDAWVEENLTAPFRISMKGNRLPTVSSKLDEDIQNIILKNYSLSLGRVFQILELIREGSILPLDKGGRGDLIFELVSFWKQETPEIYQILISDKFFIPFSELMEREIFTKKRHEKKVTFGDVKKMRGAMEVILLKILS